MNSENPRHNALTDGPLIDVHCHGGGQQNPWRVVSLDVSELGVGDFLDTNGIGEWTRLVETQRLRAFSLGIHPWFIGKRPLATALAMLAAAADNPNMLAVGECGLDRCIAAPMTSQIEVFGAQIELAQRLGKPLIVHCVRAFDELLRIKKTSRSTLPWIIHGFTGKPALAAQLLRFGCYLSFGKALLHQASPSRLALASCPLDRVFLETDAAEDIGIGEIHAEAAKILNLDQLTLRRQIAANFMRVFIHD